MMPPVAHTSHYCLRPRAHDRSLPERLSHLYSTREKITTGKYTCTHTHTHTQQQQQQQQPDPSFHDYCLQPKYGQPRSHKVSAEMMERGPMSDFGTVHSRHSATWDVTVVDTLAASYLSQSAVAYRSDAQRGSLPSTAVCHPAIFLFRWLSSLLVPWRTTLIVLLQRLEEEWLSAQGIREKRRSCTNASQWRFNAAMPSCKHFHFRSIIVHSHPGHYHHLYHHHRYA